MAIDVRSEASGKARVRCDNLELYDIVREVALVAVELAAADGGNLDPLLITEELWNGAKPFSEYPDAPSAKQICKRLKNYKGKSFPWRELLELVFDSDADIQQVEVAHTRSPMLKKLNPDVGWYALRRLEAGDPTITLDEYARRRDTTVARNPEIADCFPTVGQILFVFGSLPDALRHAGLEVRTEHYTAGTVSLREAALRFYRELGVLPTTKLLRAFASGAGFAIENVDHSVRWAVQLETFRAFIVEQGLEESPAYVPAETNAAWERWIATTAHHAEIDATTTATSEDGVETPVTAPTAERGYTKKRFWRLKSEVLEQLQAFPEWELPDGRTKRTTEFYKRWSRDQLGRPSLDSVQNFGPLETLLREARRPGAVEKAREQETEKAKQAPADREARLHRKHVESKRGQAMLALLREHGELSRAELEKELGWPQRSVGTYLQWLTAAGAVEKLGENDRVATYRCR